MSMMGFFASLETALAVIMATVQRPRLRSDYVLWSE